MEEVIWSKISQFFRELRCEDVGRVSLCETKEYKAAVEEKMKNFSKFQESLEKVIPEQRHDIEKYISAVEDCADEECQQSYMQGFIDCIMALDGMGIIQPRREIIDIIDGLK